jgi:hypothetical protein
MLSPETFYELIRQQGLGKLSPDKVRYLFSLDQSSYDEIIHLLLADNGDYARSQPNYHYTDGYKCQIAGCVLFALRPNPQLYHHVLAASLKIGDPSSCRDAVVALLQVKSPGDVAQAFLDLIDRHSHDPNTDEIVSRILDMFYWLGTSPNSLLTNNPWPGYAIQATYSIWFGKLLPWPGEKDPETTGYPLTPDTDPAQAQQVSLLILQKMLELFEANNANQTARSVISQLPLPDKEYLLPFRDRIIRALVSANTSSDEYVRQRVSDPKSQEFIRSSH